MNPPTRRAVDLEPVLEKVGRVLSDRYGIKVVCKGTRCCTDGKVIYLPSLPDDIPDDLRDAIRGYVDHEVGHLYGRSSFAVGAEFRMRFGADAFSLLNSLEDVRIEDVMRKAYPGSAVNLRRAYTFAVKVAEEQVGAGKPLPVLKQLAFAICSRAQGEPDLSFVEASVRALADRIGGEIKAAVVAPNTKAVAKLAESAWRMVEPSLRSLPPDGGAGEPPLPKSAPPDAHSNKETKSGHRHRNGKMQPSSLGDATTASPHPGASTSSVSDVQAAKENTEQSPSASASDPMGDRNGSDAENASGGVMGDLAGAIADAVNRHAGTTGAYRIWSVRQKYLVAA